jgi:hypothetical protein
VLLDGADADRMSDAQDHRITPSPFAQPNAD